MSTSWQWELLSKFNASLLNILYPVLQMKQVFNIRHIMWKKMHISSGLTYSIQSVFLDTHVVLPEEYWQPPASWHVRDQGSSQSDPRRWIPWPALSFALCGRTSRCNRVKKNQYKAADSPEDHTLGTVSTILPQEQSTNIQCDLKKIE